MPYRITLRHTPSGAAERLIDLGALDVESGTRGDVEALMPDRVPPAAVQLALGPADMSVSPAVGRDADSVWVLNPRPLRIGPVTLTLIVAAAFGTGLHPTTTLCLDAVQDALDSGPSSVLDVGTGSGVLALAALLLGVPTATGVDTDLDALHAARENARRNGLDARLALAHGGPDAVTGTWPLVLANVLAAPLIEMAPALVRRVGHHGRLVLSGIPEGVAADVDHAYRRLGMTHVRRTSRDGWAAIVFQATW